MIYVIGADATPGREVRPIVQTTVAVAARTTEAGLRARLHPRATEVDFREEIKDASYLTVP